MSNYTSNTPSEFIELKGIEYFQFEEDFIEDNVRCIPMIVRFKMDIACIKLKLADWSKFSVEERMALALKPCDMFWEIKMYHEFLAGLVLKYTGNIHILLPPDINPVWRKYKPVAQELMLRLQKENKQITNEQWKGLTNLQRFALLKLCRDGHESKNFVKALKEFKLID